MRALVMALGLIVAVSPAVAEAPLWEMDPSRSTLSFVGRQNGSEVRGTFADFDAQIRFAPDDLEGSSVRVEVDVASVDLGGDQREEIVRGSAWFNVEDFPRAVFVADGFEASGEGYLATGLLRLKGFEYPVPLAFDVRVDAGEATAEGRGQLLRTTFEVGPEGATFGVTVAPEVDIVFTIVATRAE